MMIVWYQCVCVMIVWYTRRYQYLPVCDDDDNVVDI